MSQTKIIKRIEEICNEFDDRVKTVGLAIARLELAKALAETESKTHHSLLHQRIEIIVRNAHNAMRIKYRTIPLWSFISDLTGHGSTYSKMICNELGWNPDQDASMSIQYKKNENQPHRECLCTKILNGEPDAITNPDCPLHGSLHRSCPLNGFPGRSGKRN